MGLTSLLLAYAAGLGCAPYLEFSRPLAALPCLAALLWLACRQRRTAPLLLLLFFWALGVAFFHLAITPPRDPGHVRSFPGDQPLTVEGTVLTVADRAFGRTLIDLETNRVGTNGILAPTRGRIRLYLDEEAPGMHPGQAIRFRSRLRAPRAFGTPGEFDYPRQLARQGIFVVTSLKNAREIVPLGAALGHSSFTPIEGWRRQLARGIDDQLSPASAALVKALIIGDKGGVTPQQRDLLARGGVSHLFAISGLHLGLIALFLFAAALTLYRRSESLLLLAPPRRLLPLLLLPLLFAYLLLTGNALPTRRAFLMVLAGGALAVGARRTQPLRLLASVAFLILLFEPLALFEPSFQLSFAGVLGMLLLLPRCQSRLTTLPGPLRWVALLSLTTLAATLTTTPLVLLHFHFFAPAGLLTNLFAVPAIGFLAVPLGLSGGLLLPVWADGGALLLQICGAVIEAVLGGVEWLVDWPPLSGWKIYLSPWQTGGVALLCAIPCIVGGTQRAWLTRGALLAAAAALIGWAPAAPATLTVTALSVGQGDAFLVSRADGRNYLVDGGGLHSKTFDVGERLLAPALASLGIRTLDAVLLTHDQADHRQGLPHILEHFPVQVFWCSEDPEELHPTLVGALRRRNIPAIRLPAGWSILEETGETTLALFVPAVETSNPNDRSLVLYARQGTDGVLLTGDLETPGVIDLLASPPPPGPVNLLKLPHHGSRKSSPGLLLDRFQPQLTFVSVGAGNSFHFPHAEVLAEVEQRAIPLYRTDLSGSVRFLSDGRGWRVQHWQRGLFR
jgi:competence protein ComEC